MQTLTQTQFQAAFAQDPNDEPAAELLRRLAQAPAAASPRRGRKAASATF